MQEGEQGRAKHVYPQSLILRGSWVLHRHLDPIYPEPVWVLHIYWILFGSWNLAKWRPMSDLDPDPALGGLVNTVIEVTR